MHVMSDFVGENHFNLFGREMLEQSVAQENSPRLPRPCQSGVGLLRLLGEVKLVNSLNVQSRSLRKLAKASQERLVLQSFNLVKEGQDENGKNPP